MKSSKTKALPNEEFDAFELSCQKPWRKMQLPKEKTRAQRNKVFMRFALSNNECVLGYN